MKTPRWFKKIKRNYNVLTGDLSFAEMEYLIKRDAPGMFDFYTQQFNVDKKRNIFIRWLILLENMFAAFVLKLKPARRLVYLVAIIIFLKGLGSSDSVYLFAGFALVSILLAFELADKLMAKDELEIARTIQLQLLPEKAPSHPQMDIVFFMETARDVGGDFFDFIHVGNRLTLVIGDISGKGMAAAIHMVQMNTILKGLRDVNDPGTLLKRLNQGLTGILPKSVFLTASLFSVNGSGEAELFRSGHLPVLRYSASRGSCENLQPSGIGIGLAGQEAFAESLRGLTLKPEPGDVFVMYTDGLTETMNKSRSEFGEERLTQVLCLHAGGSVEEIRDAILSSVAAFRGSTMQHDDLTLIVIKYKA